MPTDQLSDEELVLAFRSNTNAFDQLYQRYYNQIGFYLRKQSIYKDPSFIDDVREEVFLKLFILLKEGRFEPRGQGSFRAFLYNTAQKTCFDENEKRMRMVRPVSEVFTEEELSDLAELVPYEPEMTDYDEINERVKKVLEKLTPEEVKLMQLVSENVPHKEILTRPEFSKYKSVDSLKDKIYKIRKKMKENKI
ncbi:MAG: sigma-70 family RNA polymerase sigma factor [Planctomycetota bacterium]|nr:sigma-70 family RNA polymerase sigma factor [Planctomycetota bacterium]